MLKVLAVVVVGLAAAALVMMVLYGLIYLADTGASLDVDADGREGQPLAEALGSASGWSPEDLQAIRDRAAENGVHALIFLHRGRVVAEWGATDRVSSLHDARASIVSLLFGIAQDRGQLELDLTLAELGIDDRAGLTATEKQATIGDLLGSRSGVYLATAGKSSRKGPQRGEFEPGAHWYFSEWDLNVLGTIFTQRTGLSLVQAIDQWLAAPLGLVDFDTTAVTFEPAADSDHPRYEISMSARDLVRIGQMVLERGRRDGVQVVSAAWIDESTRPRSKADRSIDGGYYGHGWWVPLSGQVEARGRGGERVGVDRQLGLVCVARVFSGSNPSERATWTVLGDKFSDGEFRRLKTELEAAGGLGNLDPRFAELVEAGEVAAAISHLHEQRAADPHAFLFTEAQLNDLGYRLLGDDRVDDAIAVFHLNAEMYPEFANTHDSLGEALLEKGELAESAACYRRALELDPGSRSVPRQLRRIEDRERRAQE